MRCTGGHNNTNCTDCINCNNCTDCSGLENASNQTGVHKKPKVIVKVDEAEVEEEGPPPYAVDEKK